MKMKKDFANPEDEKYFKIAFKQNYAFWLKRGGLFLGPILQPIMFVFAAITLIILMFFTIKKFHKTDLVCTIENIHFILFTSIEFLGVTQFLRKRHLIVSVYTFVLYPFFYVPKTKDMKMKNDFANPEDEKYFKIGLKKNYGFWLNYGGLLLGPILQPTAFLLSAFIVFNLMILTVKRMYKTNFISTIETIHFLLFVTLEVIAVISFLLKRPLIISMYTILGKGFFDYENTLDEECMELKRYLYSKADAKKRIIHHTFVTVVMSACIGISFFRPALLYFFPDDQGSPDDGMVRGGLLPVWTPFDKNKWYTMIFVFGTEYIISYSTLGIVFGATFFILFSLEELGMQLQILKMSLINVIQRAERLDSRMEENIKLCLKYSIRHHQLLFEFKEMLNEVIAFPGLGLFVSFSILLCMSGFIFTLNEVPLLSKTVFGLFLMSECAMLFALCYFGEEIIGLSGEIGDALYYSNWVKYSKIMKNYMLIIQMRSRREMRLSLMGFMDISRNTFSNIISTSYSYLNLMSEFN